MSVGVPSNAPRTRHVRPPTRAHPTLAEQTPFIVRFPREIGAGTRPTALLSNVDVGATLLDLAGLSASAEAAPELARMHGTSFLTVLRGKVDKASIPQPAAASGGTASGSSSPTSPTDDDGASRALYYRYYWDPFVPGVPAHFGLRTAAHKLVVYDGWLQGRQGTSCGPPSRRVPPNQTVAQAVAPEALGEEAADAQGQARRLLAFSDCLELFDLQRDPKEVSNLASRPEHAGTAAALLRRLLRLQAQLGDSPLATSPGLRVTKVAQAKMAAFLFAAAGKGAVASLIASLAHVNNHTYHRARPHSGSSK